MYTGTITADVVLRSASLARCPMFSTQRLLQGPTSLQRNQVLVNYFVLVHTGSTGADTRAGNAGKEHPVPTSSTHLWPCPRRLVTVASYQIIPSLYSTNFPVPPFHRPWILSLPFQEFPRQPYHSFMSITTSPSSGALVKLFDFMVSFPCFELKARPKVAAIDKQKNAQLE